MNQRDDPREIGTGPRWCVVDLNDKRDKRTQMLREATDRRLSAFASEWLVEPLTLEDAPEGWVAFHPTMGLSASAATPEEAIDTIRTVCEERDLPVPPTPEMAAERQALFGKTKAELEQRIAAVADRPSWPLAHFRRASASRMHHVATFCAQRIQAGKRLVESRGATGIHKASSLEAAGAVLGVTWRHELFDLEIDFPRHLTDHALMDYSEAVQDELEEHGFTSDEILEMYSEVVEHLINPRRRDAQEVSKLADFG